ncbi:O-acyltransferase like protein [Huso huso]|uniref:O-acyltransferase like protein n=1 Tax=Huso huso TaxID=61971 RepID=A0ABR1A762_HUSHU
MTRFTCFIVLLSVLSCMAFKEKVSRKCMQDTKRFIEDLNEDIPREYAALMYDAFGKMGSDFVGGNMNRPGSFSECILANAGDFSGQYCQVMLIQEQTGYLVGLCVPDSCDEAEIEILVANDVFKYKDTSLVPPIPSVLLHNSTQQIPVSTTKCLKKNGTPDASAIVCLFVCSFIVALPLGGTIYVALIKWKKQKWNLSTVGSNFKSDPNLYGTFLQHDVHQKHANNFSADVESPTEHKSGRDVEENNTNRLVYFLDNFMKTFSLQNNFSSLWVTKDKGHYSALNGIRISSLLWIICGHNIQLSSWENLDNAKRWKDSVENNPVYIVALSGPSYLAVDTFLLIGGLLSVKSLFSLIHRADDKMTIQLVGTFLLNRLKRIQPLHIFMVCLSIGLLSVVPKGSFWSFAEMQIDICKKYWWTNMLLINNLFFYPNSCIPWSWYLAIDVQFYFTTPLLVFLLRRNTYKLIAVATIFLLIPCFISALLTAYFQLPLYLPSEWIHKAYFEYYYNKPYSRYGPYLIGILLGMFMNAKKERLLKKQWQAAVGWISSLTSMALLVALAYVLHEVPNYPSAPHAIYQGLHRTLWAVAVAWIIFACDEGFGGYINTFLSLNVWIPFSSISFACFMIHPLLLIIFNGIQETLFHYTDINFFYLYMGHIVLTVALGYVLTVLVEKPYLFLKRHMK